MAAQRFVVSGGNGADLMALGTAAAFAWRPNPGDRFVPGTGPLDPSAQRFDRDPSMGIRDFDLGAGRLDLRAFGVTAAEICVGFIEHHASMEVHVRSPLDGDIVAVATLWGMGAAPRGTDFLIT